MASEDNSQWLFTDAEMLRTPSIVHGITPRDERCLRAKGSNFILQAGILLKLPQITIATASIFFQRFYMRCSMDQSKGGIHHYTIAGTALFLATKTEENCRKTKEVVIACAKVAQKNSNLVIDEQSKEYWRWRDNLLMYEEMMLEFLTFDMVLQSPHNVLYDMLHRLHVEENKKLRNAAWAFLNDGCHTILYLQTTAKDSAAAAIYLALGLTGETLPDDDDGNAWWVGVGGRPRNIIKAVEIMFEFWTENPLKRNDVPFENSPVSIANEDELQKSRRIADGNPEETPSPGRAQSQPMQNGHSQQSYTSTAPAVNGNGTRPPPESTGNGSSDAALKEAANDPATHISNGDNNGIAGAIAAANATAEVPKPSPKRKYSSDDGPSEKRLKNASEGPGTLRAATADASAEVEESEEGELEE